MICCLQIWALNTMLFEWIFMTRLPKLWDDFLKLFPDHIQKPNDIIPISIFCHIIEYFICYVLCRNIIGQGWQTFITHANFSGCTGSVMIWYLLLHLGSLGKNAWSTINFYHKHRKKNTGMCINFFPFLSQKQKFDSRVTSTAWFHTCFQLSLLYI